MFNVALNVEQVLSFQAIADDKTRKQPRENMHQKHEQINTKTTLTLSEKKNRY